MYRTSELKSGLLHLIGWRQNYNTPEFSIADSLTQSDSGQYFQDVHPLLTLDNIKAVAPTFEDISYDAWDSGTSYTTGERVTYGGADYRSKVANINKQPDSNPTEWESITGFSLWLEEKTQASIMEVVRRFYRDRVMDKKAKNLLESKSLFHGAGRINDTINNSSYTVGMEIIPAKYKGVTAKIDKIGLQFTEAGEVTLYLMHSSQKDPVQTIVCTRTVEDSMEWFTPTTDVFLPYEDADSGVDSGGSWYLVYVQDDLPSGSKAVNKDKDWGAKPCYSCNPTELANWRVWSRYLEIHPFRVSGVSSVPEMWDVRDNVYTYDTNYGMNLQVTIMCDATDIILDQKESFVDVIGLQVAADMLKEMAYNPAGKVHRPALNLTMPQILFALQGDSQGSRKGSVEDNLEKAMNSLHVDTAEMSKVCFPCGNRGIKHRTV